METQMSDCFWPIATGMMRPLADIRWQVVRKSSTHTPNEDRGAHHHGTHSGNGMSFLADMVTCERHIERRGTRAHIQADTHKLSKFR